jgi:hypothetical protein
MKVRVVRKGLAFEFKQSKNIDWFVNPKSKGKEVAINFKKIDGFYSKDVNLYVQTDGNGKLIALELVDCTGTGTTHLTREEWEWIGRTLGWLKKRR